MLAIFVITVQRRANGAATHGLGVYNDKLIICS
jgi:hypothetical protein